MGDMVLLLLLAPDDVVADDVDFLFMDLLDIMTFKHTRLTTSALDGKYINNCNKKIMLKNNTYWYSKI